ncbi:MAG TPA: HAMP domain-containing protein, partial [Vicinamibacterales bacterium]|nr:HAMP domain-containing protein [Vicinamibacterales bacterium]
MSSADERLQERDAPARAYGLRLGVWYATLFIAGSLAIVYLTYVLTSASLEQRDRQIIDSKLGTYAAAYDNGGIEGLASVVRAEQQTLPERLFVRVTDPFGRQAVVLSQQEGWDVATLETRQARLSDGTLIEVGKSTELRDEVLSRFRAALGLVALSIVLIALSGGALATQSALRPIRRLIAAVQRIVTTGRTDERVPVGDTKDSIGELTILFNAMLDRIERLVTSMRGALDNVSHDLRTPMTHLRGSAELALAGPPDIDRYREALADCVEEADRVLVMLTTLMDISEAESGAIELHRETMPLAGIVERAVDLYRDTADVKGITLEAQTDP